MTLFGDQAATEFDRAVSLVEQTIQALGVDPGETRLEEVAKGGRRYRLRRGSATLEVSVHPGVEGAESGTLRVVAPVVRLPSEGVPALLMRLLEMNANDLAGVAFGVASDQVVLVAERSVRDLDASEVDTMLRTVGREADRHDDLLAQEFGTTRASDPLPP
jgi:hypothetical protein